MPFFPVSELIFVFSLYPFQQILCENNSAGNKHCNCRKVCAAGILHHTCKVHDLRPVYAGETVV